MQKTKVVSNLINHLVSKGMHAGISQAQPRSISTLEKRLARCNRAVSVAFLLQCPLQNLLAPVVMFVQFSLVSRACTSLIAH